MIACPSCGGPMSQPAPESCREADRHVRRTDLSAEMDEFMDRCIEHDGPTDDDRRWFFEAVSEKLLPGDPLEQDRFVGMMMKLAEPLPGEEPDA